MSDILPIFKHIELNEMWEMNIHMNPLDDETE
jgi:hypothetical protein